MTVLAAIASLLACFVADVLLLRWAIRHAPLIDETLPPYARKD